VRNQDETNRLTVVGGELTLAAADLMVWKSSYGSSRATDAPPSALSQAAVPLLPEVNNWSLTTSEVNAMDGVATPYLNSADRGVFLHLCFQSNGACDVPVVVQAPLDCFIENNVDGYSYRRQVRVRFDDEKPQVEAWGIVDSHHAIYQRGPKAAFIDRLKKHKKFTIELGCASYDSDVVTLDAGLTEAMTKPSVNR
jgi:hypothetical protein